MGGVQGLTTSAVQLTAGAVGWDGEAGREAAGQEAESGARARQAGRQAVPSQKSGHAAGGGAY